MRASTPLPDAKRTVSGTAPAGATRSAIELRAFEGLFPLWRSCTGKTSQELLVLGGPATYPLVVCNDCDDEFGTADVIHNGGSFVAFVFADYMHTALSGDSLADVDWANLLTFSSQPHSLVREPNAAIVPGGSLHTMFLRAPNAAVVVEGTIEGLSVEVTPPAPNPVPEPAGIILLASGLVASLGRRRQ